MDLSKFKPLAQVTVPDLEGLTFMPALLYLDYTTV